MSRITNAVKHFLREEDAPTAVEYGLMVALIAVVIMVGAGLLGANVNDVFNSVAGAISGVGGG
jgi:pilus assembly protein Flp/PilA